MQLPSSPDSEGPLDLAARARPGVKAGEPPEPDQGSLDPVAAATSATLAATFGLLVSGLVLAMLGLHHAWLQAPLAGVIAVALFLHLPRHSTRTWPLGVAVILTLLVIGVTWLNIGLVSELVTAGRDGATYANTASFLVEGDGLFPQAIEEPFTGLDLEFKAPGFVVRDDGTFWQQFLHAPSAMYAFFGEVFGKSALFAVNALLSGVAVLAIFSLASRLVAPWWALLATVATAVSLPFAYYSRGTFSEMATLVMSIGGLWVGHVALTSSQKHAVGAGLLLGCSAIVRVDAWMTAVAIGLVLVMTIWLGERREAAIVKQILSGFGAVAALGLIDLALFSEPYIANLGIRLQALILAAILIRLLAPLATAAPLQRLAATVRSRTDQVNLLVTIVMVAFMAYIWFGRALLPPSTGPGVYGIEALQIAEGVAVEPTRSYAELSMWWLVWYLGIPMIVLGTLGAISSVRRAWHPQTAALRLVVFTFLVPAATYLIRPSINPDHIWAIRRFLPIVIPILVIFAMVALESLTTRLGQEPRGRVLSVGLVVLAVAPVLVASGPLFLTADRPGLAGQMEALCERLGTSRSVLIVDDDPELPLTWRLGPPLRSWCHVSVAGIAAGSDFDVRPDAVLAADEQLLPSAAEFGQVLSADAWTSRVLGRPHETEVRSLSIWVDLDCCDN